MGSSYSRKHTLVLADFKFKKIFDRSTELGSNMFYIILNHLFYIISNNNARCRWTCNCILFFSCDVCSIGHHSLIILEINNKYHTKWMKNIKRITWRSKFFVGQREIVFYLEMIQSKWECFFILIYSYLNVCEIKQQ